MLKLLGAELVLTEGKLVMRGANKEDKVAT